MNIIVFSWRDPKHSLAGGAEQVMHEHMKGWVEAGYAVSLFCSQPGKLPKSEVIDGVKIIRGGYQYLGVQIRGFFYYLSNRNNFDLVIDQFHGIPFFTPLFVRKPKLAVIQEPARKVWFLNHLPFPINYIVGLTGYLFEPLIFTFYRNIPFMTGSLSAKRDIIKLGIPEEKIAIVSHGVIVKKPKPYPKKEKEKTLVFLGVLAKDKGIEDAIRCFGILAKKEKYSTKGGSVSGWNFWIIGKAETPEYRDRLSKITKSLGLTNKIKFWGFVSQEKKFELLARAHILLNPSVHEGWGLVNIEANAMGTPVIAYNSSGLIDSVNDGISGIILKKNTPKDMAGEVEKLINDALGYKRLSQGAISWSKRFAWEKSKRQSLSLVKGILLQYKR